MTQFESVTFFQMVLARIIHELFYCNDIAQGPWVMACRAHILRSVSKMSYVWKAWR